MTMVPEEMLVRIGDVVVSAVQLEYCLACAATVLGGDDQAVDPLASMTSQGGAVRAARAAVEALPGGSRRDELSRWVDDAAEVLGERHRVVHGLAVLYLPDATFRWVDPREPDVERHVTEPQLFDLALRLSGIAMRDVPLIDPAADSARTDEGSA